MTCAHVKLASGLLWSLPPVLFHGMQLLWERTRSAWHFLFLALPTQTGDLSAAGQELYILLLGHSLFYSFLFSYSFQVFFSSRQSCLLQRIQTAKSEEACWFSLFAVSLPVFPSSLCSYLYQIAHLGDDDEEPEFSSAMPLEEGDTFFFQPRPLKNLVLVDELDSLSPILCCQVCA